MVPEPHVYRTQEVHRLLQFMSQFEERSVIALVCEGESLQLGI